MTCRAFVVVIAALLLAIMPLGSSAVEAQDVDCQALRARIDAASSAGARAGQYASALRRQQYELQRTQDYADSIGCNADFMFNASPAQCEAIASRITRMQQNLDRLQQQAQSGGDEGARAAALTDRYNASCSGAPPQAPVDDPDQRVVPVDPDAAAPSPEGDDASPAPTRPHRVRALCVRECDGGFFPITDEASSGALEDLGRLCQAMCPNTKAILYTAAPSAGIETAAAADGTPYTSLPAAFKFQKSFDATCSCKPPHQSWVEALADAESLIESGHGDVTVTQTMSDAMSRPGAPAKASRPAPRDKPPAKIRAARKLQLPPPPDAGPPNLADQAPRDPEPLDGETMPQLRRDAPTL